VRIDAILLDCHTKAGAWDQPIILCAIMLLLVGRHLAKFPILPSQVTLQGLRLKFETNSQETRHRFFDTLELAPGSHISERPIAPERVT
jgi:hypothetical protein